MELIRQIGTVELSLSIAILITPVLPKAMLMLLDLMVVRALIIIGALWAISSGPFIGLLAFVLIGVLYMERNRLKIIAAQNRFAELVEADTPAQMTVEEEGQSQKTVPVREFDTPKDKIMYYIPREGCAVNSNEFEPVSGTTSLNDKEVFPAQPQGEKAVAFYDKLGVGHIRGVSMAE